MTRIGLIGLCVTALFAATGASQTGPIAAITVPGFAGSGRAQTEAGDGFVAFRVDDSHAIAVLKVLDETLQPVDGSLSAPPAARFGFPYFTASATLQAQVSVAWRTARWQLHVAPGRALDATADRIVGGSANCQQAVAVLLTIAPAQQAQFKTVPHHYFVAEAQDPPRLDGDAVRTGVRMLPAPALPADRRQSLESLLHDLLARDLPAVRDEADPEIERMASSTVPYHRSWAAERRRVDEALSRGAVRLSYDIQAFRLDPAGAPVYFVRAEWLVGARQAFAAAVWLRGDPFEIVEADTRPSAWLRMFEFQGEIAREHLGLVLNVLDIDRDGWGEVVMARGGYESLGLAALEYSRHGFTSTGASFAAGC
jgi:hypothetical protein